MKKRTILFSGILSLCMMGTLDAYSQTTVLTENFSGNTNIFGVTATTVADGTAAIFDTKLTGYGQVLAVCHASAEGQLQSKGQPIAIDGIVTVEWDAFHGYFVQENTSTVSLLNSEGRVLASYVYSSDKCQIISAVIGEKDVVDFKPFALQTANGFSGNGKPYTTSGIPHMTLTMTARGGVTLEFKKNGQVVSKLLGSLGTLKKDVAVMKVESTVNHVDRCYAIDNVKVTTDKLVIDPDYVEPIANVAIAGDDRVQFGPSTSTAFQNNYKVNITGADGTLITEDNLNEKVKDFKVVWDIDGFKTENDTEGQYCDSYGAFSVNNQGKVATSFDLREVPMNFYGKMTATVTYNGTTTTAEKYVVALGNLSVPASRLLPLPGYPVSFSDYPASIVGYQVAKDTYGTQSDLMTGGWCLAGSDSHSGVFASDADGRQYVQVSAPTAKKSHVMTHVIEMPDGQVIFDGCLRMNNAGALVTLTQGYPFWASSNYACPVSLDFDGSSMMLNGSKLKKSGVDAQLAPGAWCRLVLSADKSSERCYAMVYDLEGNLIAESGVLPWTESASPTYLSIGLNNSGTGSVDVASCELFLPEVNAESFTLTADKTTLSIPQGESARLTASIIDNKGYAVTQQATWTVVEEDMQSSVLITPDANDSHIATVSLTDLAAAGTATIQVSIGGYTKTLALSLTSSAESIRFTQSTTSISIPMDEGQDVTATFAAVVIDGDGQVLESPVTLAAYDQDGMKPYDFGDGMQFEPSTGVLTVSSVASPAVFVIRATGKNSKGEDLSKGVKVNVHGMKFDFGYSTEGAVAEGYTAVDDKTTWNENDGYGRVSGTVKTGGTPSVTNAESDYLEGSQQFDFKVQPGSFYTVEVTYQGQLTTGYINSDLAGYELGNHTELTTESYTMPATLDVIDLHIAPVDATSVARIAKISITKQAKRQKRSKRAVHHIGDSTSANNGSWAHRLKNIFNTEYPELAALCDFQNNGAGGRNLCTYYTQGRLANVLRDIYPDDVVMMGNNGTNGMGKTFEEDMNYYLDAAEALGAKIIINSYTPHGAVSNYSGGYNASTHTFDSYRKDKYETVVRSIAAQRAEKDVNYLGFVEIGKHADAIFNAYVKDYAANGYADENAAAQAIIQCFSDHNHYSNGTLACELMLNGYATAKVKGIVAQLVDILKAKETGVQTVKDDVPSNLPVYDISGRRIAHEFNGKLPRGLYIIGGRKVVIR